MEVVETRIKDIRPYGRNPRKNKGAVGAVAASIREFGFKVPIVLDKGGVIVAGHTRYEAARKLGLAKVPCIIASDLTDEQIRAFRLADNQAAEFSTWDEEKLAIELEGLGLDMTQYGFMLGRALEAGEEIDVADYDDEKFAYCCPECALKFNA